MIGVSKWKYSQSAIDERQDACNDFGDPSDFCKNEAWFIRELSQQLQEKFDIRRNLTFAFMDSYSQSGQTNLNDEVQQSHWIEETNKLWSEATARNETFDFKTIDDVLEENALCKEENNRLNDIISEDIKQLKENVTTLDKNIVRNEGTISENQRKIDMVNVYVATLSEDVDNNKEDIEFNQLKMDLLSKDFEDLQDDVATVQGDVVSVSEDVQKNSANITKMFEVVSAVQADVASNQGDISEIQGDVSAVQEDIRALAGDVERNSADITTLATTGAWCGVKAVLKKTVGTITYDYLTISASNNMNIDVTPLDINTGINSHKCYYYLDIDICRVTFQGSSLCRCLEPGD